MSAEEKLKNTHREK